MKKQNCVKNERFKKSDSFKNEKIQKFKKKVYLLLRRNGAGRGWGAPKVPRVSRGSPGNRRKARVAAIVKIVELLKENIGFQ